MTVRRSSEATFAATPTEIKGHVLHILRDNPEYKSVKELSDGLTFATTVRPSIWLLGTPMTVQLEPCGRETRVRVGTRSQFFIMGDVIMGDVLNYYNGYIQDFLSRVEAAVARGR